MTLSQRVSAKFPASAAVAVLIALVVTWFTIDSPFTVPGVLFFLISWLAAAVFIAYGWAALDSGDRDSEQP